MSTCLSSTWRNPYLARSGPRDCARCIRDIINQGKAKRPQSDWVQTMYQVNNFTVLESVYGRFIVNRHCAFQAESLVKTGHPHIQHELNNILALALNLPEHSVTIDAGANIGLVCVPVAQTVKAKGGTVHAFEIQRPLFYALCGTAALNDLLNLHVHQMGLGAAPSVLSLAAIDYGVAQDFGVVSLVRQSTGGEREAVTITTIDALQLPRIDLLKVDVEGMEVDVLRGGRQMIETFQPWAWVEHWISGIEAIKEQFVGLDYKFYRMDDLNMVCAPLSRIKETQLQINAEEV